MNKRIVKAHRQNNEFKQDWLIAERLIRMGGYKKVAGIELQAELMQKWLKARKMWC